MAALQAASSDNQVKPIDTIWQMALASFSANNDQIVLPLAFEKSLSTEAVEELKARLSRHLGRQTVSFADPLSSAFRIVAVPTSALEFLSQLAPGKGSRASSTFESLAAHFKQQSGSEDVSSDHGMKQPANKDKEKHAKIPRPPNAFILYRQHHHPLVKAENPDFHNNDISKVLGKQWKEESPAVRDLYKAQALERKAAHLKKYPDYQYAPRKPGEKKRRASRKDMEAEGEKEQYETLRFIDTEGDFYMESDPGSAAGDDDMDLIGTNVDEGTRSFHLDGDCNTSVVLPVSNNSNLAKMVEAQNKRAEADIETYEFAPSEDCQVGTSIPPHVENDTDFFEALIDWEGIAEDFKIVQQASGEELAGLAEIETGNPYLSLSDEDQRALFEAELERTLQLFN